MISLVNISSLSFSTEKTYCLAWITFRMLIKFDSFSGLLSVILALLNINANPGDIVKIHPLPKEKSFLKK